MFISVGRALDYSPKAHLFKSGNFLKKYILNGPRFKQGLLLCWAVISQWYSVRLQIPFYCISSLLYDLKP